MLGIKNGMVMQRNADDICEIIIHSEVNLSELISFYTYNGINHPLSLLQFNKNQYILSGIPVGGPYTVTIGENFYSDIYVGDVWLLAGQSNMQGMGACTEKDIYFTSNDKIRTLDMSDFWKSATPILHNVFNAFDKVHTDVLNKDITLPVTINDTRCIGPGYFFASKMFEYESVPQGVIPCAHGGTTMDQWSPAGKKDGGDKSLYGAMYRRFVTNGSKVRGLFWYQGCSEANSVAQKAFQGKMLEFIKAFREDFGNCLPIIQVQIGHVFTNQSFPAGENDIDWNVIRETQRIMSSKTERLATVYVTAYDLEDTIHLNRNSHVKLGYNAADLMHDLIHGKEPKEIQPDIDNIYIKVDKFRDNFTTIHIPYKNVSTINAEPKPFGFKIYNSDTGKNHSAAIYSGEIEGNTVVLKTCLSLDDFKNNSYQLYYCYGLCTNCNLITAEGYSLPAFGPVTLKNILR